jgi:hypothetical protein
MPLSIKDSSAWKTVNGLYIKDGGAWKTVQAGFIKDGGAWKQFYSNVTTVNVSTQNNVNLRTLYTNQTGGSPSNAVSVIFNINGNIGSTSTGTASMITDVWPAGSNIVVNIAAGVYVVGAGGAGGYSNGTSSAPGQAGGTAISLGYSITIVNNGVIGGGGGGGGTYYNNLGGGGAGKNVGAAGRLTYSQGNNAYGNPGTLTTGGAGYGFPIFPGATASPGANGGNLGTSASTLVKTNTPSQGETTYVAGGTAGKAVALNNNSVTWSPQGTTYGGIS